MAAPPRVAFVALSLFSGCEALLTWRGLRRQRRRPVFDRAVFLRSFAFVQHRNDTEFRFEQIDCGQSAFNKDWQPFACRDSAIVMGQEGMRLFLDNNYTGGWA